MRSQADAVIAPEGRTRLSVSVRRPHLIVIMKTTERNNAAPNAHRSVDRISVHQRSGVWRVRLNDDFYGDYARRYWALESAFAKADEIAARGGAAMVTWAVDGQQDALLYDTRGRTRPEQAKRLFDWPQTRRWPPLVGERFARRLLEQAKG